MVSNGLGGVADQFFVFPKERVQCSRVVVAVFEQRFGELEERGRDLGRFGCEIVVVRLGVARIELGLGGAEFARRHVDADIDGAFAHQISVLEIEQLVGRRTIFVLAEIY